MLGKGLLLSEFIGTPGIKWAKAKDAALYPTMADGPQPNTIQSQPAVLRQGP